MCGAAVATLGRRTRSQLDLLAAPEGSANGLKSTKSYSDLKNILELPHGLSSLRIDERETSTQSGSDDTGRSSPTEHLLRSRSPCAVLFAAEDAAASHSPTDLPPVAAAAAAPNSSLCGLLPTDTPFLESAASFSVVEVPLATGHSSAIPLAPPAAAAQPPRCSPPARGASMPFLAPSRSCSLDAQAAAAVAAAEDPVCAAAVAVASQSAFFHATAAASATSSPPKPSSPRAAPQVQLQQQASIGLPPLAPAAATAVAPQPSPFSRLAMAEPPSAITPQPGLLSQHSVGLSCSRQSSLLLQPPSVLGTGCCQSSDMGSSAGSSPTSGGAAHSRSGSISAEVALARRNSLEGWGTSSHLSEGHAAEELFYRLNHARQTVDFVKRQATAFSQLNKAMMGVWEALELLNTLREYETALLGGGDDPCGGGSGWLEATDPDMPLLEHALQCAEACRVAFPDEDYMHLAGLLAPLGKLLAHAKFGAEPQWAICGETFPVGCRFHPAVRHSQYFSANPDRRKRLYSSPTGVYREGCGLGSVLMSWGAGEYLHLVLRLNRVALPPEALFCIRHLKLRCVFRPGGPYSELLSEFDRVQLARLQKFQQVCAYRRQPRAKPLLVPVPGAAAAGGEEVPLRVSPSLRQYYDALVAKYIPQGVLLW